jgi:DNA invertase Pin-like site-specific DNA recombinase
MGDKLGTGVTRAAIYARVSTDDQVQEGTSLTGQLARCQSHAAANKWQVVGPFVDGGVSGALRSRPALDRVMRLVEDGEVDLVVITKLDRIARSLRHLLDLLELFERKNVLLVALDDPIDPSTASGRAMVHLRGVFAELERQLIRERTTEGLFRRVSDGGWPGGPPPYGYKIIDNPGRPGKVLALDEDEAAIVRLAYSLLVIEGATTGEVATELNRLGTQPRRAERWTHWNLRRLLLDARGLSGSWPWRRSGRQGRTETDEVIVGIPAILDPDEHERLLGVLASTSTHPSGWRTYLLRGRILSPHGTRMQGVPGNGQRWYRCPHRHVAHAPSGVRCECRRLHALTVESAVWEETRSLLSDPNALEALAVAQEQARTPQARREREHLGALDARIAKLEDQIGTQAAGLAAEGLDPGAIAATVRILDGQLAMLRDERATLMRLRGKNLAAAGLAERFRGLAMRARQGLDDADDGTRNKVLELLDVRVEVQGWEVCSTCQGRGLLRYRHSQRRLGNTGNVCPACRRTRHIPDLRITGQIPETVLAAIADEPITPRTLRSSGSVLAFETAVHIA